MGLSASGIEIGGGVAGADNGSRPPVNAEILFSGRLLAGLRRTFSSPHRPCGDVKIRRQISTSPHFQIPNNDDDLRTEMQAVHAGAENQHRGALVLRADLPAAK